MYTEVLLWYFQQWYFSGINIIPKYIECIKKWIWWWRLSRYQWYWNKLVSFIWYSEFSNPQLLWKRGNHINDGYGVTVRVLCVIPHSYKNISDNYYVKTIKQVNIVIKILFHSISDDEMNYTIVTFWS